MPTLHIGKNRLQPRLHFSLISLQTLISFSNLKREERVRSASAQQPHERHFQAERGHAEPWLREVWSRESDHTDQKWNNKRGRRRWHRAAARERPRLWEECILQHLQRLTFTMEMSHQQMTTALRAIYGAKSEPPAFFQPPGKDHRRSRYLPLYSHWH